MVLAEQQTAMDWRASAVRLDLDALATTPTSSGAAEQARLTLMENLTPSRIDTVSASSPLCGSTPFAAGAVFKPQARGPGLGWALSSLAQNSPPPEISPCVGPRKPLAPRPNSTFKCRQLKPHGSSARQSTHPFKVPSGKENVVDEIRESLTARKVDSAAVPALARSMHTMTLDSPSIARLKRPPPPLGKVGRSRSMSVTEGSCHSADAHAHAGSLRSTSMDVMHGGQHTHAPQTFLLPRVSGREVDVVYIDVDTMAEVLAGQHSSKYSSVHVLDARFPYEYEGGHIQGATNIYTPEMLTKYLADHVENRAQDARPPLIIMHCEFSQVRGPKLFRHLRKTDRTKNLAVYPHIDYPELYVLKGGYEAFFQKHKQLCDPQNYVEMRAPEHHQELKEKRPLWKKHKTWSATTFVQGQTSLASRTSTARQLMVEHTLANTTTSNTTPNQSSA